LSENIIMLRLFGLQIVLAAVSTRSVFGSGDDSCTWEIAKKATWCAGSYSVDKKKLSEEGTGSDECMDLATADPECGDTIYSNDDYCRCILSGKSCDERESSSGTSNVFQCTSPGRCVPEITGLAADDCDDYFSQYECEKYGVSAMSDGICDWEYDPCAGAMCTLEMCPDESMPPIPEDGCCPDVSLCGIKEIPDCEQILCGCPPPSKEIEAFDDNGCRSCSCEYAECSEDDTKESLNPCETFYCDSGRWVSAMMACDMCPPNMVSIDDGSCCGSCEEIPDLCEQVLCGCPPPSKEIEMFDDNGCRSCSCETEEACPEVKCLMYCEAGYEQDEYGCDTCTCIEPKPCEGLSTRKTKTCEDCQITLGAELLVEDCGVACASETKTNKIKKCTKKCNKAVKKLKKNDKKAKKKCKKYEM